jgi:hypothetical protein
LNSLTFKREHHVIFFVVVFAMTLALKVAESVEHIAHLSPQPGFWGFPNIRQRTSWALASKQRP